MCEVFFLGTARNIPSQISARKPGTCIEMDGNAIADKRGCAVLVRTDVEADPKRTRDRLMPAWRCSNAMLGAG